MESSQVYRNYFTDWFLYFLYARPRELALHAIGPSDRGVKWPLIKQALASHESLLEPV
jgi:hypothetical protein